VTDPKVSVSTRSRHKGIDASDENYSVASGLSYRIEASVGLTLGTTRVGSILTPYLCYRINLSAYRTVHASLRTSRRHRFNALSLYWGLRREEQV